MRLNTPISFALLLALTVLGLGFFPFATSDYYSTRMMGTLLPFCLIVALLADVLLVPAMAKVGWIAFPAPEGNVTRSNPRVAD